MITWLPKIRLVKKKFKIPAFYVYHPPMADFRRAYLAMPKGKDGLKYSSFASITKEAYIAAQRIGRQLNLDETPCFLDGNKNNLDPSNIIIMTRNEVRRLGQYRGKRGHGETAEERFNIVMEEDGVHAHLEDNENSISVKMECAYPKCPKKFFKPNINQINRYQRGEKVYCSKNCRALDTRNENTEYYTLYRPDEPGAKANGSIAEHRYVAQHEILHRPLLPEECIHHIDGDKRNNDPSNLMVFATRPDHSRYHRHHITDIKLSINENGAYTTTVLKQIVVIDRPEYKRVCLGCGRTFYVNDPSNDYPYHSYNCQMGMGRKKKNEE